LIASDLLLDLLPFEKHLLVILFRGSEFNLFFCKKKTKFTPPKGSFYQIYFLDKKWVGNFSFHPN